MKAVATNLFGETASNEVILRISFKGPTFEGGEIQIGSLYRELESLERVLKKNISLLVASGKLDSSFKDAEILIQIEKGSIIQSLRIIFSKKAIIGGMGAVALATIPNLISETYAHFLNGGDVSPENVYASELKTISEDPDYKKNLANLICPVTQADDQFVIEDNHGTINIITQPQKEELVRNLQATIAPDPFVKNGEYNETLTGVVRKLDLDANAGNYFGFTIDNGPAKIPASIRGEFNLSDIKEIIDEHLAVSAVVRYKEGTITHIEIISYTRLGKQDELGL